MDTSSCWTKGKDEGWVIEDAKTWNRKRREDEMFNESVFLIYNEVNDVGGTTTKMDLNSL